MLLYCPAAQMSSTHAAIIIVRIESCCWRDPELAFDPETVQGRHQIFEGDAFSAEMSRRGVSWPQYTVVNQQRSSTRS